MRSITVRLSLSFFHLSPFSFYSRWTLHAHAIVYHSKANETIIVYKVYKADQQIGSRLRDKITNMSYYLHLNVYMYNLYTNFHYQ